MTKRKKSGFTKTVAFTRFKQTVLKWWEGNESKYRDQLKSLKHMPFTRFRFDFPHAVPRDDKEAFGRLKQQFCQIIVRQTNGGVARKKKQTLESLLSSTSAIPEKPTEKPTKNKRARGETSVVEESDKTENSAKRTKKSESKKEQISSESDSADEEDAGESAESNVSSDESSD